MRVEVEFCSGDTVDWCENAREEVKEQYGPGPFKVLGTKPAAWHCKHWVSVGRTRLRRQLHAGDCPYPKPPPHRQLVTIGNIKTGAEVTQVTGAYLKKV